jgi:hypothetical protein
MKPTDEAESGAEVTEDAKHGCGKYHRRGKANDGEE